MKKISQIAKETGVNSDIIRKIIDREKIKAKRTPMMMLDKHQEEVIQTILYFEGRFNELTLESKINS